MDNDNVYWANDNTGVVMKVPKGVGTTTMLASGRVASVAIAEDATNIYWVNFGARARSAA